MLGLCWVWCENLEGLLLSATPLTWDFTKKIHRNGMGWHGSGMEPAMWQEPHTWCVEPCHCFLPPGMHWQWQVPSMMEGSWSSHTSVVNGRASVVYLVPSRWEVPGPGPGVRAGTWTLIDPLNADAERKGPLPAVVCHSAEQAVTHIIQYFKGSNTWPDTNKLSFVLLLSR